MPENVTIINPNGENIRVITPSDRVIISEVGAKGEPGTTFNGGDIVFEPGKGPILIYPGGVKKRMVAYEDELGNPGIDFVIVP